MISELRNQIDQILRFPTSFAPEEFHRIAASYAELVSTINQRVSICNRWLDKGLRSEAVHMASIEPDLLQTLSLLDLGDSLDAWDLLCEANNATLAPKANWVLATYINEACESEIELKPMLEDLRLAMLEHATMQKRIELLRTICSEDEGNPLWDTMVREHESIRIDCIREEVQEAIDQNDLDTIKALKSELFSADWIEPPPQGLLDLVSSAKQQAKTVHVNIQFSATAHSLHKAMSEGNEKRARKFADNWKTAVAMGLRPPESAVEEASPVFEWLQDIDNQAKAVFDYNNACETFTRALDEGVSFQKLEVMYNHIERIGLGVPDILASRFQNRQRDQRTSQRTKLVVKLVLIVVVIGSLATAGLLLNRWNARKSDLATLKNNLISTIDQDEHNIELIKTFLQNGYSHFPNEMNGSLSLIVAEANEIISKDDSRREGFESLLATIGASGVLTRSDSQLEELLSLASTDPEKKQANNLVTRTKEARAQSDATATNKIELLLASANANFSNTEKRMKNRFTSSSFEVLQNNLRDLDDTVREIQQLYKNLFIRHVGLGDKISSLNNSVKQLLASASSTKDAQQRSELAENELITSKTLEEYIDQLEFLHELETYQNHEEISRVYMSVPTLKAAAEWSLVRKQLPANLNQLHDKPAEVEEINKKLIDLSGLQVANRSELVDLFQYVDSVVSMYRPANSPKNVLDKFLNGTGNEKPTWNFDGLKMVSSSEGNYYGVDIKIKIKSNSPQGKEWWIIGCQLSGADIALDNQERVAVTNQSFPGINGSVDPELAGVRYWNNVVRKKRLLTNPPASNPDVWYLDLLEEIANIKNMNPLVRLSLTARVAKMHKDNSWYSIDGINIISQSYTIDPPEDWPNPKKLETERSRAKFALSQFGVEDVQQMKKRLKIAYDEIVIPPDHTYVGVVWYDDEGKKNISINNRAAPGFKGGGALFALTGSRNEWDWIKIGEIQGDKTTNTSEINLVPFGAPVFIENQ